MGVLGCDLQGAVTWFCERYPVPTARIQRRGRPKGSRNKLPILRVGATGSELEPLVRSGLWANLSPSERAVLQVLCAFRDVDTNCSTLSYRAIMRYSGIASTRSVSRAIRRLSARSIIKIRRGSLTVGPTRNCSTYEVTLNNPKLLACMSETYQRMRGEISLERELQSQKRVSREKLLSPNCPRGRDALALGPILHVDPLCVENQHQLQKQIQHLACTGIPLSLPSKAESNLALQLVKRFSRNDADVPKTSSSAGLQVLDLSRSDFAKNSAPEIHDSGATV